LTICLKGNYSELNLEELLLVAKVEIGNKKEEGM